MLRLTQKCLPYHIFIAVDYPMFLCAQHMDVHFYVYCVCEIELIFTYCCTGIVLFSVPRDGNHRLENAIFRP